MLLCCFLLSFTCSAVDDSYLYDLDNGYFYQLKDVTSEETTIKRNGPLRAASSSDTSFSFPDFDKNKIDVASFPDYVQKILSSTTSIVFLIVTSNLFYFWVADGCIPTVSSTNGNLFLFNLKRSNGSSKDKYLSDYVNGFSTYPSDFISYSATYFWNSDDDLYSEVSNDWSISGSKIFNKYSLDDNNKWVKTDLVYYTYNIPSSLSKVNSDFFVFGNNDVYRSQLATINFAYKSDNFLYRPGAWFDVLSFYNTWISDFSSNASKFKLIDGGSFPTASSQQSNTQRGILGLLKSLPDKISGFFDSLFDKIKGLFVPADGFFDTYFNDLKSFFAERFGFLYDLPAAAVTILNQLVSFKPAESGYKVHFPSVSTPVLSNGSITWHEIISERDYYFDFLNKAPFSTLYSGYRSFVWLAYCFMLVNLAKNKADSILGGK